MDKQMDRPVNSQRALGGMQQSQEEEGHPGRRLCEQWVGDEAESYLWALGSGRGGWCSCCSESRRPRARRKAGWVVSWELGEEVVISVPTTGSPPTTGQKQVLRRVWPFTSP